MADGTKIEWADATWQPITATLPDDMLTGGTRKVVAGQEVTIYPKRRWIPCSRVGKKAAGRLLDGREWNEVPR